MHDYCKLLLLRCATCAAGCWDTAGTEFCASKGQTTSCTSGIPQQELHDAASGHDPQTLVKKEMLAVRMSADAKHAEHKHNVRQGIDSQCIVVCVIRCEQV